MAISSSEQASITPASSHALPRWSVILPVVAMLVLVMAWNRPSSLLLVLIVSAALITAVLAAIHHAEVVAHRVGEPFGTLVLAVAVTVIEASLIVSVMLSGGETANVVARDAVFAAVMIVCNGIVGSCLLIGGLRHHVLAFRIEGTRPALAALATLAVLTLVMPAYLVTTPGPSLSVSQLAFAGLISLVLYAVFVFVQTVRHRDYFLPVRAAADGDEVHAAPPPTRIALMSFGLLCLSLIAVIGLAKTLAPTIERGVIDAGLPIAVIGIVIALLVLLPESGAAIRAAMANRLQTSLNLALGSGLATIGLTIPVVAVLSIFFDLPLLLGIPEKDMVLLALTLIVASLTLGGGTATVLQGAVHLVLFAAFLFLAVVP
ncbi:MAG: calcium:proton antiporter [Burkholderiaceae bacterium]